MIVKKTWAERDGVLFVTKRMVRCVLPNQSTAESVLTLVGTLNEAEMMIGLQRRRVVCEGSWSHSSRWAVH